MTKVWLSEILFSDNSKITIEENEIIVLVGPNNAGKSATLKEAARMLRQKSNKGKVVLDISIEKNGDKEQLISYINAFAQKTYTNNPLPTYNGFGFNIYEGNVQSYWNNITNGLSELANIFVNSLSTEQRLSAANPPQSIKITTNSPQHPIHFLQKNDVLEKQFSDYFKQAFGTDLIVHRNAGNEVPL